MSELKNQLKGGPGVMKPPLALLLGFVALVANEAPAQSQVTAMVSGRVEDVSGAVVGGAMVTVKSMETGSMRVVFTEDRKSTRLNSSH